MTIKALVLLIALASAAVAQTPPPEDPLFKQLMDRDRVRNGASILAGGATPLYDGFYGNLGPANPAGAVATGKDFLKTFGPLLGFAATLNPATDVTVMSEAKTDTGTHVVFAPAVAGVPYIDASFAMDFDSSGNLVGVQGRYDSPAGAKMATIDVKTAVKKAIAEIARRNPGLTPSRGGTVEEYLHLTDSGSIEHRFTVALIVGDQRHQRRVVLGPGGEVLEEAPDDDNALAAVKR